jgi:hypothetical protein
MDSNESLPPLQMQTDNKQAEQAGTDLKEAKEMDSKQSQTDIKEAKLATDIKEQDNKQQSVNLKTDSEKIAEMNHWREELSKQYLKAGKNKRASETNPDSVSIRQLALYYSSILVGVGL